MDDCPPIPSRLLKVYAAVAKGALWLLLTAWLVLALAWGALHAFIVPKIGELRPALEVQATRVLGVPVQIGRIEAYSEGFIPSFELSDVALLDPAGRRALRLPRVLVALSPKSLLKLGFEQLYIDSPELDIRRAKDGKLFVAGLDFSRARGDDGQAADWFFSQPEFVIVGGTIRWTDEMRNAPPLALDHVDLVMRNGGRRHAMRIDATPPAAWGERFTLRGIFRSPLLAGSPGHWQEWTGEMHGDFARVDVSQLRRYADFGVQVSEGHGAVRAWADIAKGQLMGGVADIALANVSTTLGRQLQPLALQSVSGRLGGKRLPGGFEVETHGLQFQTQEGLRWPGGNVFARWQEGEGSRLAEGEIRADKLDLAALGQIASRLPLSPATHRALAQHAPKGLVETLNAKWRGPIDALASYEARGRASQLEVAARAAVPASGAASAQAASPGFRGATIEFEATQSGGRGRVALHQGALEFPGVFEDPALTFDDLSADLQWKVEGQDISASVTQLKFANADALGDGQASWRTGKGARRFPGVLDLQAGISRAEGNRVWRYLPNGVPKTARDYVRESVLGGTASNAKFRVKGDLRDFPFKNGRGGEFRVTADVKDVTFAYVPRSATRGGLAWPGLTKLDGHLHFEGNGMQVKGATGRFANSQGLQFKAEAQIPDFATTIVGVTADIKGPLGEALAIVNNSPVSTIVGPALAKATGNGNADVKLKLDLPVATIDKSRVQGSVVLAGNDIQITPDTPMIARARGTVNFSDKGFALAGTQARALGGDVRIDGGTRALIPAAQRAPGDAPIYIRAQGTATADGLRQAKELGFVARLAKEASGSSPYTVNLAFRRGVPEVAVTSSLQGLALNLPAPMNKAAETALPLRYENALTRESLAPNAKLADQLTLDIGRLASIVFVRDLSGPEPRVLRGGIGVGLAAGESVALPEQGVMANINLANVNLDTWEQLLAGPSTGSANTGGAASGGSAAAPGSAAATYLPTVMAVRAKELVMDGRSLHNVVVGGSRDGPTWRANVDGNELNGYVEYRQPSGGVGGRLHARLARLSIAATAANQVEALLEEQPANLPALDIVVDDFELRGKKLGRLEIDAVNRGAPSREVAREGTAREWRLNKLNLTVPEATFTATGNWAALNAQAAAPVTTSASGTARPGGARPAPERMRTAMRFRLDVNDSGALLARFGMRDVVRRGKGRMEGQVAWIGSPLSLNYPTMDGNFNVNMESGQFLKADPGLAKLLGVLSLQSLPRRLTLDFRDVFTEGFAFDFVRGDITIEDGIAATNNLQMKGVNAAVLMEGKADIARETQDLKVVVVPEINAGTASLVAGVINPAIGLGTFLAQMVLRQPLIRAATQEFHIDGTWTDPRIARVRKGGAETPVDTTRAGNTTPPANQGEAR